MRNQNQPESAGQNMRLSYLNKTFGQEDEILQKVRIYAESVDRAGMQVSPHEGQLLKCLVGWTGSQRVLECGTLFGYSALWMAKGLQQDGKIITVEKDSERHRLAKSFFAGSREASKIEAVLGDAMEIRDDLARKGLFDLIFIDANKSAYLETLIWSEGVLKKGGFVVADNSLFFGAVYGKKVSDRWGHRAIQNMVEFNERLADPSRYLSTLVPTDEGLTVAQKLF